MDRNDREGRDAAGVGPYARERERLVGMSTLKSWALAEGEPDIRGWGVRTVSGRQLGSVRELLVDQAEGEVILLDIDLPGTDRHTFVPIRVVALDRPGRLVLMDSADLPDTAIARSDRGTAAPGETEVRSVRYPVVERESNPPRRSVADGVEVEREVEVTPQEIADRTVAARDVSSAGDRRQVLRRSTDRPVTEA